MIITRTPYRISFFGGGTDYPEWCGKHGGAVLATSIDKYCYLTCRYLPPFFDHTYRIVYSKVETCNSLDEVAHPVVREGLRYLGMRRGIELHHDGDLPARSGMGSSCSFTVGLLHALYALKGRVLSKQRLTEESTYVEREILKETVGLQDQVSAAFGGFNHIVFSRNGDISVRPMTLPGERIDQLNQHLLLFYTGIKRTASDVADSYVGDIQKRERQLHRMREMVDEGIEILDSNAGISQFGELLHEAWQLKRSLSDKVSNPFLDGIYDRAMKAGGIGGKITGAGGGGFLLVFAPPSAQENVKEALREFLHVPFGFENGGSQILFYDQDA